MSEKEKMATIWISGIPIQRNPQSQAEMMKIDGRSRSPDTVVKELIEFWKKHQP